MTEKAFELDRQRRKKSHGIQNLECTSGCRNDPMDTFSGRYLSLWVGRVVKVTAWELKGRRRFTLFHLIASFLCFFLMSVFFFCVFVFWLCVCVFLLAPIHERLALANFFVLVLFLDDKSLVDQQCFKLVRQWRTKTMQSLLLQKGGVFKNLKKLCWVRSLILKKDYLNSIGRFDLTCLIAYVIGVGFWILNSGAWIFDFGSCIWILDFKF